MEKGDKEANYKRLTIGGSIVTLVLLVAVLATASGLAFSGTQLSLLGLILLVVFLAPGMVLATGGLRIAVLLAAKLAIAVIWLGWWRSLHDADPRPQFDC